MSKVQIKSIFEQISEIAFNTAVKTLGQDESSKAAIEKLRVTYYKTYK